MLGLKLNHVSKRDPGLTSYIRVMYNSDASRNSYDTGPHIFTIIMCDRHVAVDLALGSFSVPGILQTKHTKCGRYLH